MTWRCFFSFITRSVELNVFGVEEMALGNIQLNDSEVTERLFGGKKANSA